MSDKSLFPSQLLVIQQSDRVEKWAKVVSLVGIPVVLGISALLVNSTLKIREISRDYVKLSITILQDKESKKPLKEWAVSLLETYSEVKLSEELKAQLSGGTTTLPAGSGFYGTSPRGLYGTSRTTDPYPEKSTPQE